MTILLLASLAGLALRLAHLQVVQGGWLHMLAQRQQLETITLAPHRGRILDRSGRPLAINVDATSVYAVPSAVPDQHAFARRVAPVLGQRVDEVERRLGAGLHFAWLARQAPPALVSRIRALQLDEQIGFLTEDKRAYPNRTLAAQLLGFAGIDNQGLSGVELAYDAVLRGASSRANSSSAGRGRVMEETQQVLTVAQDGQDVLLTVDQVIQHITERELLAAVERTHARAAWAVVMDPLTGEILAMATVPPFDPNAGSAADPHRWLNRPVSDVQEPGSTFKIFLMASALDSGVVSPTGRFFCGGSLPAPGGTVIRDSGGQKHGWQTMAQIVMNSCNVGAAQVATHLGKGRFFHYIREFGFGRPVGIDVPGEAAGIVLPPTAWRGPGLQTISFGQGISTTTIQLLTAVSALVNDGVTIRPYVVRAVRDHQGQLVRTVGRQPLRRVIRPDTAEAVLQMMIGVTERGTGTQARIPGYTVAGKTATAQKPIPTGGYDPDRFIASFLGIVPIPNPRLAALVVVDEPRGAVSGGEVAAPIFRQIASQTLWYLRVAPGAERLILSVDSAPAPPTADAP
jgi:cell division protein FtsI (penicillin-binding protein 3)